MTYSVLETLEPDTEEQCVENGNNSQRQDRRERQAKNNPDRHRLRRVRQVESRRALADIRRPGNDSFRALVGDKQLTPPGKGATRLLVPHVPEMCTKAVLKNC